MFGVEDFKNKLWVEKYRPNSVDDYVFKNDALKAKVLDWIRTKEIPSMLIHGPAGTGKTSLINVILNSIEDIDESDVLELNMSEAGMDDIRDVVLPFVQTIPYGSFKVVVLEEFEMCSQKGQSSLKRIMEEYSYNARFILTSNVPNKILPPIRSRCQEVVIEKHDYDLFSSRVLEVLIAEGVELDDENGLAIEIVDKYINSTWPDFRKCLNTLQGNIVDGKLLELNESSSGTAGFELKIIEALNSGTLSQMRKDIVQNITEDQIEGFFSFLYRHLDIWIPENLDAEKTEEMTKLLILKIRDGIINDNSCFDREINLSATLVDLQMIQSQFL